MAPLPESESTLRAVIADRQVPWPEALRILSDVAHRLVEMHRHGSAHGSIGLDTVTVDRAGTVRLLPPPEAPRTERASAAYGRDTQALGELLATLADRTSGMPAAARRLAGRTADGRVVTPAAFAAELDRLAPRPTAEHHRILRHHPQHFAEASIDEIFGGMGADRPRMEHDRALTDGHQRDGAARPAEPALPPELDPRRPARAARPGAGRRGALAALAAVVVLVVLVLAVVILPRGGDDTTGSSPTPTGTRTTGGHSPSASHPAQPPASAVRVVSASAYDPGGDGSENDSAARLADDGDPSTAWTTDRYATPDLGGLKPGVGLVFRLGRAVAPRTIRITFGVAGSWARVYVGSSRDSLLDTQPIATVHGARATATLQAKRARTGRLLLVWLTKLPPADSGGGYRGTIAGISVTGGR